MGNFVLDWEYLPEVCLHTVLEKIDEPASQVQFGSVSKHWHSMFNTFLDIKRRSSTNLVPMLLIPTKKSTTKRKLYSLQAKAKVSTVELPEPYRWRCCGSSFGWIATSGKDSSITLSNPFKNNISINLPRLNNIRHLEEESWNLIRKVALLRDPLLHPNSYFVIVLYSGRNRLALYRSWQKDWTYFGKDRTLFTDVILHRSSVYAIGRYNNIVSFDVDGVQGYESCESPKLNILVPQDRGLDWMVNRFYIVKSSMQNLYYIQRHLFVSESDYIIGRVTKNFTVFKLILDNESGELLEKKVVKSMDGDIVFIGDNGSLAVSALDFPQGQPNSIYFTDDFLDVNLRVIMPVEDIGDPDIGIFHLKDGSFEKFYEFKYSHKDLPPYIWIMPPVQFVSYHGSI